MTNLISALCCPSIAEGIQYRTLDRTLWIYEYASHTRKVGLPAEFRRVAPAMEDRERQKACVRSR